MVICVARVDPRRVTRESLGVMVTWTTLETKALNVNNFAWQQNKAPTTKIIFTYEKVIMKNHLVHYKLRLKLYILNGHHSAYAVVKNSLDAGTMWSPRSASHEHLTIKYYN